MDFAEFNEKLATLLAEFFKGVEVGDVPIRMTFQLWAEHPDPQLPLKLDLSVRRVWRD